MSTSLGHGKLVGSTDKALQVKLDTGETLWIPRSVVHDDSELYDDDNNEGDVVVKTWWAEKEGLG